MVVVVAQRRCLGGCVGLGEQRDLKISLLSVLGALRGGRWDGDVVDGHLH